MGLIHEQDLASTPKAAAGRPDLGQWLLAAGVQRLAVVPSSGFGDLFKAYPEAERCFVATREEEAVAFAAGCAMAGAKVAVCMQQSGVGNCLNAVATLADAYEISFPILVLARGPGDENPVQRTSYAFTRKLLRDFAPWIGDFDTPEANFVAAIREAFSNLDRRWLWLTLR